MDNHYVTRSVTKKINEQRSKNEEKVSVKFSENQTEISQDGDNKKKSENGWIKNNIGYRIAFTNDICDNM